MDEVAQGRWSENAKTGIHSQQIAAMKLTTDLYLI
jgi:hypothetical protein